MTRVAGIVFLLKAGFLSAGCTIAVPSKEERTPVRWIVVETLVGDAVRQGDLGHGRLDPTSRLLALEPLYAEDISWEVVVDGRNSLFVEVLEITPARHAAPGETVMAKVRVGGARPGRLYRLIARPSQENVEILGEPEKFVRGDSPAVFRFTSLSSGRAGIAVEVERAGRDGESR